MDAWRSGECRHRLESDELPPSATLPPFRRGPRVSWAEMPSSPTPLFTAAAERGPMDGEWIEAEDGAEKWQRRQDITEEWREERDQRSRCGTMDDKRCIDSPCHCVCRACIHSNDGL